MTGQGLRCHTDLSHPDSVGRHACHQHHRLRIGGQRQGFLGAVLDQLPHVLAQCVRRLLQHLLHLGVRTPCVQHAHSLRALPRKNKSKRFHDRFKSIRKIGL